MFFTYESDIYEICSQWRLPPQSDAINARSPQNRNRGVNIAFT